MGQESPIEPWLAPDNRAACESPNGLASSRQNDENRWQRKPKALREGSSVPRSRNGRPKQSCSMGWAGRQENLRPKEKSFFLDSLYRTYRDLGAAHADVRMHRLKIETTSNGKLFIFPPVRRIAGKPKRHSRKSWDLFMCLSSL